MIEREEMQEVVKSYEPPGIIGAWCLQTLITWERMGPGMDKKVMASVEALKMGVKDAIITSGLIENPITEAANYHVGTVITRE